MNKSEAQKIVYQIVARSLRNVAKAKTWPKFPEIPVNMTDSAREKVRKEMRDFADRLTKKYPEPDPIDGEVTG